MEVFNKKLWCFEMDFGRMGAIASTFFATDEQIADLRTRSVYMNDVLGKHSEITIDFTDITEEELFVIEDLSENTLKELNAVMGDLVGGWFYPWDYKDQWAQDETYWNEIE